MWSLQFHFNEIDRCDYSYRDSWLSPLTPVKTREDYLDEMPCVLKSEDEWNLEGTKLAKVGVASNVMERKGGVERLDRWASDLSLPAYTAECYHVLMHML